MLVEFHEENGSPVWVDVMRVVALELVPDWEGCFVKLDGGYEVSDPLPGLKPHDYVHKTDNGYFFIEPIGEVANKINAALLEVRMIGVPYLTINPNHN